MATVGSKFQYFFSNVFICKMIIYFPNFQTNNILLFNTSKPDKMIK